MNSEVPLNSLWRPGAVSRRAPTHTPMQKYRSFTQEGGVLLLPVLPKWSCPTAYEAKLSI